MVEMAVENRYVGVPWTGMKVARACRRSYKLKLSLPGQECRFRAIR